MVILDEPTIGLDPIQIREIRNLIRELGRDHGVILSTHILPEVQATCGPGADHPQGPAGVERFHRRPGAAFEIRHPRRRLPRTTRPRAPARPCPALPRCRPRTTAGYGSFTTRAGTRPMPWCGSPPIWAGGCTRSRPSACRRGAVCRTHSHHRQYHGAGSMILTIALRELRTLFLSPLAWSILAVVQLLLAFLFLARVEMYQLYQPQLLALDNAPGVTEIVLPDLLGNAAIVLLLVVPLLTMRLIAEERRNKTLTLLVSAPVSMTEIVLGKYLGVLLFLLIVLALIALMPLSLLLGGGLDPGLLFSGLLGLAFCSPASPPWACSCPRSRSTRR